jgi:hypothetical protein
MGKLRLAHGTRPARADELNSTTLTQGLLIPCECFKVLAHIVKTIGVGTALCRPSLRTGLADFPHPALQLVVLPRRGLE